MVVNSQYPGCGGMAQLLPYHTLNNVTTGWYAHLPMLAGERCPTRWHASQVGGAGGSPQVAILVQLLP